MNCLDANGDKLNDFNSWLVVDRKIENERFINSFCDFVKDHHKNTEFYLIISGDLSDSGNENEFLELKSILNKIVNELKIKKEKILIVPGDHDVNWIDAKNAFETSKILSNKKVYDYNEEKFLKFSYFYSSFYEEKKHFDPEKTISDILVIDELEILYLGLNSNFKIGAKSGLGYIDHNKLEIELKAIVAKYSHYYKIAVVHHNFIPFYKNEPNAQWESANLTDVKRALQLNKVDCYVFGNEHTPTSKIESEIPHISIGTFGKKNPSQSFNIFAIKHDVDNIIVENKYYEINNNSIKGKPDFGEWDVSILCGDIKEIQLKKPSNQIPISFTDILPTQVSSNKIIKTEVQKREKYIPFDKENSKHKELIKIIKLKNLFHSGHFHWSETSRAHNWIDVSKLLGDRENLNKCKKYIYETLIKSEVEYDFIIGLGVEGNMLATRTAILSSKPYAFLPYSYRYDDHSDFEKKLNYENDGRYKSILIVTDVVHDGRTIRKLINKKREKDNTAEFFKNVKKITVVSLFYTGDLKIEKSLFHDILNKRIPDEWDHHEERIEFHFVSHIKVEECPYNKNNYKTDCIIVKEGLGCIHKFYTEK